MRTAAAVTLSPDRFNDYEALSHSVRYGVNLHPLWLATYIDAFQYSEKQVMLEARDETGALHGLLPLVRKDSRESRFITQRRLVPAGYGPSDFFGLPATPGREAEVARAMAGWFAGNCDAWDRLMTDLLPEGHGAWAPFADQLAAAGFDVRVTSDRNYLRLDSSGSYEEYLARLGAPKLKELRYYRNRLLKRGGELTVRHLAEGLDAHFDDFVTLYTSRRHSKEQSDPYTRVKPLQKFVAAIIPHYERRGWVTLSLLSLDDVAVAYCYCLTYDGVLYYYMPTFRQEYQDCAPGKLLLMELIKRAFETPSIREFNFMRSEYDYKHWFEPDSAPYFTITASNRGSRRMKALRVIYKVRRMRGLPAPVP